MRTEQTAGLSSFIDIYHTQSFVDHAGQTATRVRFSDVNDPIPTDFHAKPIFTFQIYLTASVDLDERSAKRIQIAGNPPNAVRLVLHDLIDYIEPSSRSQRPPPLYEIYTGVSDLLDCVDHQRREIAHRKANRDNHEIPPIPLVAREWEFDSGQKDGFVIVVDSEGFKSGDSESEGPLWVYFERRSPDKLSWVSSHDDNADARVDASSHRIQLTKDINDDLAMLYWASYAQDDPPSNIQESMSVAWEEDEGSFHGQEAEKTSFVRDAIDAHATEPPSLKNCKIANKHGTRITISNCNDNAEPDMRYVIYVPFLHEPDMGDKLEVAAKAFTHDIATRTAAEESLHFEFHKPPSVRKADMLAHFTGMNLPAGYIGALKAAETAEDATAATPSAAQRGSSSSADAVDAEALHPKQTTVETLRVYPISESGHALDNDPSKVNFEPYRTFFIVLESPDFLVAPGAVLFILADGGKLKPIRNDIRGRRGRPVTEDYVDVPRLNPENQNYVEMQLLRMKGMDEVARRLQML